MPDASDFTRMKRMVASVNEYRPASPAVWVPRFPVSLPNMIHSNKFTKTSVVEPLSARECIDGGDPFTNATILLSGGEPFTNVGQVYSGGFP